MDEAKPAYKKPVKKLEKARELIAPLRGDRRDNALEHDAAGDKRVTASADTRKLREAYIESEQNFRNSMNACPLGIRVITAEGQLIYANHAILDICGCSTIEELKAVPRERLYTPESYAAHQERKAKRQRGEYVPPEYKISIRRPDGAVMTLQVFRREIKWGGERQFMALYEDITARLQAEEALAESQEMFAKAFHHSPVLMLITSRKEGRIVEVNDVFCRATGYTREELLGRTTLELNLWNRPAERGNIVGSLKGKGIASGIEVELQVKSGEIRIVNMSTSNITLKNEPCLITIAEDITDRKKAEEELKLQRDFNQEVFNTAQAIMLVLEPDGRIATFNPYLEEISGYKLHELKGKSWFDVFIPESDRTRIRNYFTKTIDNIHTKGNINPILTKDGREREIEWYNKTLKDHNGRVIGVLAVGQDVTERHKLEDSVRYHASLVQSISDAIISSDAEFKLLSWNKGAEEMYGWREEEVIGKGIREIMKPANRTFTHQELMELLRKGGYWKGEDVHQRRNGEKFHVLLSVSLLRDDMGNELGAVTVVKDITERRIAEEKYQTVVKTTLDGFAVTDLKGKILDVNDSYCRMTGYTRPELLNMSIPAIEADDSPEEIRQQISKIVATGYGRFETRHKHKDGHLINVEVSIKYHEGNEGQMFVFVHDITMRKRHEERINHLNMTLRSIRNVNQLITREKDRDRLIKGICDNLVASHSFASAWIVLLDDSRRPVTWAHANAGSGFSRLIESFKGGELPHCVQKALKQKRVVVTEDPYEQCQGCPVLGTARTIGSMTVRLESGDNIYGILCASMPKNLLLEEDEKSLFSEVADDIAFALRNIELAATNELLQQERLRTAKLESIGTLAGGIAHDFNNLLTGIMGNIGLAKSYLPSSGNVSEMLDEAERAAARSRDLTQQLLTFARGGKPIKKLVDIADIIRDSATFAVRGSKVRLELSLPDDLWLVEADEGQISQVMHNLAINAEDAMSDGGTLKIKAKNLTVKRAGILPLSGGNYVQIDVSDTGIGISPEHLQKIFEPYFTTKPQGNGLGLTTAYAIIKNHGGSLFAESSPNQGSAFHIYLPASKKTRKGEEIMAAKKSTQAGGKVLIMDDDATIRKMLKNMLNLAGYEVEVTADGAEALEKYKQAMEARDPFTAVIMDLTIPGGMGGKEAIKKLLEIDPAAAVVVSSGYATDAIMSEYKKYGFSAVIAKPYSIKQLQETITGLSHKKKK